MNKIVAVGDEEFTMGFELVGVESQPIEKFETLISKGSEIGIIILSHEDYENMSIKLKSQIDKLLKPIVVILSKDDIKGSNLRDSIIKALGVDLLK